MCPNSCSKSIFRKKHLHYLIIKLSEAKWDLHQKCIGCNRSWLLYWSIPILRKIHYHHMIAPIRLWSSSLGRSKLGVFFVSWHLSLTLKAVCWHFLGICYHNFSQNTTIFCPKNQTNFDTSKTKLHEQTDAKGQLNSERIYEIIVSPKITRISALQQGL